MTGMDLLAPTLDDIEDIARRTVADLPDAFREAAAAVAIVVADFADDSMLDDPDMDPFDLTGLYDGVPLTQKSSDDQPVCGNAKLFQNISAGMRVRRRGQREPGDIAKFIEQGPQ